MDVEDKSSVYDHLDSSDDSGPNLKIRPSSFYNGRKSVYVSPLERKHLKRGLSSSESDENKSPPIPTITKGLKSAAKNKKTTTSKFKAKDKISKTVSQNHSKKSKSKPVLKAITPSNLISSNDVKIPEVNDEKYKNNKFFKHKPSREISFSSVFETKSPGSYKKWHSVVKRDNKKGLNNVKNNQSADHQDLSISEGYHSSKEESVGSLFMSNMALDINGSSEISESVRKGPLSDIETDVSCSTVDQSRDSLNVTAKHPQPMSVQEILKDLEESFNQIDLPELDSSSRLDETSQEHFLNEDSQTASSTTEKKLLYPIFYPPRREDFCRQSPQDKKKSKLGIVPKTSFIAEAKQLMIDAGQKVIGAVECPTCGMVYHVGNEHDDALHVEYHDMFNACLKFPGWKKEHVLGHYSDGKIIMVTKEDINFKLKKIEDVLKIVDRDLGFPNAGFPTRPNATFLLFISNKMIIGCLIAESITYARRIELDSSANVSSCFPQDGEEKSEHWCSSKKLVKAICGINRIWVSREYRRKKIATRLLNCLRCNFLYGHTISTNELAFSDPSVNGRDFAAAYTRTSNFLVYK